MSGIIHPTAIVDAGAEIGNDVKIGPYCVVGGNVRLENGVELLSHVIVDGHTVLQSGCQVFPFASIGLPPQDVKYRGEPSRLEIGRNTVVREHVTVSPGTEGGGMLTKVGEDCRLMIGAHVGHDCRIGNNVIMVNNVTLGGHVEIGDWAILGGMSAVHQFVRIGRHAMVGGMSGVENDVIPYGSCYGNRARLSGLNLIGLKRRGFSREVIHALRNAYRLLFAQEGTMVERLNDVAELFPDVEPVMEIVEFVRVDSSRAICQPPLENAA
jgi:UDP-N-acetylglucosamine acyltransferase